MSAGGGVQRIEITERESPVFGGAEFAGVGNYERLHGTVFGELDPTHHLNANIVNLDKAARNARGHVADRLLLPEDGDRCWRRRGSRGTCTKRFRIRDRRTLQDFG
jgi:hypothetical protein